MTAVLAATKGEKVIFCCFNYREASRVCLLTKNLLEHLGIKCMTSSRELKIVITGGGNIKFDTGERVRNTHCYRGTDWHLLVEDLANERF